MTAEHYITATATNKDQPEIEFIATDRVSMDRGVLVNVKAYLFAALSPKVHYDLSMAKMSQEAFGKMHESIKAALELLERVK